MSAFTDQVRTILKTMTAQEIEDYAVHLARFAEQMIDLWTEQNDSDDELYSDFFHEVGYLIEDGPTG